MLIQQAPCHLLVLLSGDGAMLIQRAPCRLLVLLSVRLVLIFV